MNFIFAGVGNVVGFVGRGLGEAVKALPSFLLKGATSALGTAAGGGARLMTGLTRKISTTSSVQVTRTAQGFIRTGTNRAVSTVRGAATGSLRTAATANTILSAGYRLYSAIQSLLVLVFVYLIVKNISNLVAFALWAFGPIGAFMAFIDDSLNGARDMLRKKSYDPSMTSKNPSKIDWAMAAFLLFLEFLVFCVQEGIVLVSVLLQTLFVFVMRILHRPWFWLIFGLFLLISAAIEHNYIDMADTANTLIVAGEAGTRQLFRVGNIGLDIYDTMAPFQNVAMIYTVGKIRVLCDAFCPEPFKSSPTGRRLLEETPEELIFKYEQPSPVEGRRRRRLIDTNTMRTKIKRIKKVVNKLAFGTYLMNLIDLRITALYLILARPLMEILATLSSPIERLVSKIYCAMVGGFWCSLKEVAYFATYVAVEFINSRTILNLPFPGNFACKKGELVDIDPAQCGNWLDAAKPPGSFYSALVPEGATQIGQRPRSLGAVYANVSSLGSDDTGEEYPLLECKQHPVDNSWVETLDGKVVHMSQYNKCPLSRHVFGDEFSNVRQFNSMGIDTECYIVCLHDVKYESCHNQYTGHVRRLLGSCNPSSVKIENENQARRRLNSLFPDTYFGWSELFEGEKRTSPVGPSPYGPHQQQHSTSVMNSEELVKSLRQSLKINPKFTVFGIECDIKWEASIERLYVNMLCIGLRMVNDYGPSFDTLFFSSKPKRGRSLMEEQVDKLKAVSYRKWSSDLKKSKDSIMDTVSLARSYIRLLHSTDKTQSMDDRIDEMIDVSNYQPRRRIQEETQVKGFDEPPIKDIGWCQGEDMYPCPGLGPCVPVADRDLCPEPDMNSSETTVWQKLGYYMNRASTIDFDPEEVVQDINQCYRGIEVDTETNPVTLTNLEKEDGGGSYCAGTRPPFPYRFPEVEIKGINRFIASGCVVDDVNSCTCDFYYRPLLNYDLLTFHYTDADLEIKFINFCTWMHHLAYVILLIHIQFFQDGWYGFISYLAGGPQRLPLWLLYFFGDWGIRASIEKQWYCWGLHSNSAMTSIAILVLAYDLIKSLDVLSYWFWSLVRRVTYFHHPLFWPKTVKKSKKI